MITRFFASAALTAAILPATVTLAAPPLKPIGLKLLGTYHQPVPADAFDESAAEISAYDPASGRLFVTNGAEGKIDVLDLSIPSAPTRLFQIPVTGEIGTSGFIGDGANSVAVYDGLVAVAIEAETVTDNGAVAFFDVDGNLMDLKLVGALPDMLTFTRNGDYVLVANEGEPDDGVDPEGSVSVIDLSAGVASATVRHADFNSFDSQAEALKSSGVRLFPDVMPDGITVSQDLEPEYIAADQNGKTALVALQEANSVAVLDIKRAKITAVLPLGTKHHNVPGNGLDPSDKDDEINDGINIGNWPLKGMFMPDAIASYRVRGETYYVTANEGDDRGDADKDARGDAVRFKDIEDVISFERGDGLEPSEALQMAINDGLQDDDQLGRINISTIDGLNDEGELDELFSYGARSFTIWDSSGALVWDSGVQLEKLTADLYPDNFNASNDTNDFEDRSDNKGPEPEAVTIAKLFGRTFAFIGLERIGGVAVYEIGNPVSPVFITYINNRDFEASDDDLKMGMGGDLGPESVVIIQGDDSPTDEPLMVVANEVSGTVSVFEISQVKKKNKRKK